MSVKQIARKKAVGELMVFFRERCALAEDGVVSMADVLGRYSYESGVSVRTLREYFKVLVGADLITGAGHRWSQYSVVEGVS